MVGVEAQLREHEASRQAVAELMKYATNEAQPIIAKITDQVRGRGEAGGDNNEMCQL